jgi:hypothetical protein
MWTSASSMRIGADPASLTGTASLSAREPPPPPFNRPFDGNSGLPWLKRHEDVTKDALLHGINGKRDLACPRHEYTRAPPRICNGLLAPVREDDVRILSHDLMPLGH